LHGFSGPICLKWQFWEQNGVRGDAVLIPTNSFFTFGVLTSVPILLKIDQEMRPWECGQMDTLTDAKQFYNLSHAMYYSCGAGKDILLWRRVRSLCTVGMINVSRMLIY